MSGWIARLESHAMVAAAASLTLKITGSVLALVLFVLAARALDVADYGRLVMLFNAASLVAVVAMAGQDTLILRSWGEYAERDPAAARAVLRFGAVVVGSGATIAALGTATVLAVVDRGLGAATIAAVAAFAATQTVVGYAGNTARAIGGAVRSETVRELVWRLPLFAFVAAGLVGAVPFGVLGFFVVAIVGQVVAIAAFAVVVVRGLPATVRAARPGPMQREWIGRSVALTAAVASEAAHQYADVLMVGFVLGPAAAAGYFVIARIAGVFPMLTSGLHNYTSAKAAMLHYAGETEALRRLLAQVTALASVFVAGLLTAIVLAQGPLLGLFGEAYVGYGGPLVALSAITAFATLTGPGSTLLMTMGLDVVYLKLVVTSLAVRISCLLVMAPAWGVWGAVLAVGAAVVPLSTAAAATCVRRFGVDPSIVGVGRRLVARLRS